MSGHCDGECKSNPCICSEMRSAGITRLANFDAWLADQDAWVQCLAQSNTVNEAMRRAYYAGKGSAGIMTNHCENCKRLQDELDNWKARYVALFEMLRHDALDNDNALPRRDYRDVHDARIAAIEEYRARLLARIDEAGKEAT